MLIANASLYWKVWIISLLFVALGYAGVQDSPSLVLGIFAVVMIGTGIPHGATDHLVYRTLRQRVGAPLHWGKFLGGYLLTIAAYGAAWWCFPGLSLLVFLGISAYHFGQSQVLYLRWRPQSILKQLLGLSWGSAVLAGLLLMHLEESAAILSGLVSLPSWLLAMTSLQKWATVGGCLFFVTVFWVLALWQGAMSLHEWFRELLTLIVLGWAFYVSGLWLGFALYFGFWHSLSSIHAEVLHFQKTQSYSWKSFARDALPFSLISFVGIVLLGIAGYLFGESVSFIMLFFIAISTLTLPHMVYMDHFYRYFPGTPAVAGRLQ